MDGGKHYFNRVGHVAIVGPEGNLIHYGSGMNALDFKFSIKKSVFNPICEAKVEVYGLNMPTIQRLTYWGYYTAEELMKRRVLVYAGYADSGECKFYEGYGYRVTPTQPPNAGVIIEAKNNLILAREPKSITVRGKTDFSALVEYVAGELKLRPSIDKDVPEKKILNFHTDGTTADMLSALTKCNDVYIWIESERETLRVCNKEQKNPDGNVMTLDVEHGLLGVNSLTLEGIEARVRLDYRYDRAKWVRLNSSLYPKRASGNYMVYEVEHRGHFRGQEWETIVRAYNTNRLY